MAATAKNKKPGRNPAKEHTQKQSIGSPQGNRQQMVAEAAYYHAEQRGFMEGDELQDWLAAENEIDRMLGHGS